MRLDIFLLRPNRRSRGLCDSDGRRPKRPVATSRFDVNQTSFRLPAGTQLQVDAPESAVEVGVLWVVSDCIIGANQPSQLDKQFIALFRLSHKERSAGPFNKLLKCAATAPILVFLIEPLEFGDIAGHKIL